MSEFYVFNVDVDVNEESPPPLPERTPESFVLASEHSEYLFYFTYFITLNKLQNRADFNLVAFELHN